MVESFDPDQLSAIVLAGGQSSRMGQDKALILIEEVPLLQRICEAAMGCASRVLVLARQVPEQAAQPYPHPYRLILPAGCELVFERSPSPTTPPQGPLVGFTQGLALVNTPWVLLLACDLPRIHSEILCEWAGLLPQVSEDAIALLPHQNKGWEPLCGFYRSSALRSLKAFVQKGGRSFQCWLAQEKVEQLRLDDPTLLWNCNTPEDLQQLTAHPPESSHLLGGN